MAPPPSTDGFSAARTECVFRFEDALRARLDHQRREGLWRQAAVAPPGLIDLSTNDYLGLRRHPRLAAAAAEACALHGVGAGASRLAGGTLALHRRVESRFASFKGAEAALILPTGYVANLALLSALAQPGDLLLGDRLNHASLLDGARLASALQRGVAWRTYPHRDLGRAHTLARRHLERGQRGVVWLISDSVFSMDGDVADARALADLRDRLRADHDGRAGLILDEAHATGVLGPGGAGLDAQVGHVADATVSTASKALGSLGGIICGSRTIIETVVNFARPFIYSTAAPPPQLAAIEAALDTLEAEPARRERLRALSRRVRAGLRAKGWPLDPDEEDPTPIIPLVTGDGAQAMRLARTLADAGFHAPAIRPPTVAPNTERVRLSVHADLQDEEVDRLLEAAPPYHEHVTRVEPDDGDEQS